MAFRRRQKILVAFLTLGLALSAVVFMPAAHSANNNALTAPLDISAPIDFRGADNRIGSINEENVSVRKLLRSIAKCADVNIVLDDSVEGNVSLSFGSITVKQALEYLRSMTGLYYSYNGNNILMVTNKDNAVTKGLNKSVSKIIPVKYISSRLV
ncbi:MAG: secretin and TonB N-terminal domain-containing protein, partial [Vampirovibrionia bacterium]